MFGERSGNSKMDGHNTKLYVSRGIGEETNPDENDKQDINIFDEACTR